MLGLGVEAGMRLRLGLKSTWKSGFWFAVEVGVEGLGTCSGLGARSGGGGLGVV